MWPWNASPLPPPQAEFHTLSVYSKAKIKNEYSTRLCLASINII